MLQVCSWGIENKHEGLLVAVAGAIDSVLAAAKKVEKELDLLRDPSLLASCLKNMKMKKCLGNVFLPNLKLSLYQYRIIAVSLL